VGNFELFGSKRYGVKVHRRRTFSRPSHARGASSSDLPIRWCVLQQDALTGAHQLAAGLKSNDLPEGAARMFDARVTAISLDQFIIGRVGHVAKDATAKLSLSAVKALAPALLGLISEPDERPPGTKHRIARPGKPLRRMRLAKCKYRRSRAPRGWRR